MSEQRVGAGRQDIRTSRSSSRRPGRAFESRPGHHLIPRGAEQSMCETSFGQKLGGAASVDV